MMRALYTAASGMIAQQLNIDNISQNLANVQTTGYKKSRVDFQDLLYVDMESPGMEEAGGTQIGLGVRSGSTQQIFTQGMLQKTENNFDLAIQGDGFFEVAASEGTAYTRDGSLTLDKEGYLVNKAGFKIIGVNNQPIKIAKNITNVIIKSNGDVEGTPLSQNKPLVLGTIKLTKFLNPAGLRSMGINLYNYEALAGGKQFGKPNTEGLGLLAPGYLEKSNVNVVEQMVSILQAQRAFEISQKGVQSADEMMRIANQMKKA
ncbi:MAG: flagellar basal-body rod protein FlgG [Armatimonadetes bacterium]|nr:flagellar basal-body rod protein FlgG [Armatimonadota bacterium]